MNPRLVRHLSLSNYINICLSALYKPSSKGGKGSVIIQNLSQQDCYSMDQIMAVIQFQRIERFDIVIKNFERLVRALFQCSREVLVLTSSANEMINYSGNQPDEGAIACENNIWKCLLQVVDYLDEINKAYSMVTSPESQLLAKPKVDFWAVSKSLPIFTIFEKVDTAMDKLYESSLLALCCASKLKVVLKNSSPILGNEVQDFRSKFDREALRIAGLIEKFNEIRDEFTFWDEN